MKIVFAGSPRFAVPTLERLVTAGYALLSVITQPDRTVGREQRLQPTPVKEVALRLELPIYQPERIKRDEPRAHLEQLKPEAVVVVGYGQILPPWLLELPKYGCINLHGSLLPAYRGAAPIQWAVANGEMKTGLTTMLMDPGMDTGPILLRWETGIGSVETSIELGERMCGPGAELMIETLQRLEQGTVTPQPQDDSRASRASLLKKEHGLIDWNMTAGDIFNRVRGFQPWPGAYTGFRGKKLQVWRAQPDDYSSSDDTLATGHIIIENDNLCIICGNRTTLKLLEVQLEGKRRMSAADFLHGNRPTTGELLNMQSGLSS